jgi:RNA recognition motif-containing protein
VEVLDRGCKDRLQPSGLAIVRFSTEESAADMAKKWEGKMLDGRPTFVSRDAFLDRPEIVV